MTLDEKREEVAGRMARSREYDGENCTSIHQEFYQLIYHGSRGVVDWDEQELDEYLAAHNEDGQSTDEFDEDDEEPEQEGW